MKKIILSIASLALMCTYSLAQNAPAFTTLTQLAASPFFHINFS